MISVIKIHCRGSVDFPTDKRRERLCQEFEKSNLFEFIGKSRVDGYNLYKVKDGIERLGKIQKIQKINPTILDKIQELLDKYVEDVQSITIFKET